MSTTTRVVQSSTTDAEGQRHCTSDTVRRAEKAEELRDQFLQQSKQQQAEIERLHGKLQAATAVHPGWAALREFPEGQAGGELALLGALALLAGAALGLPGQPSGRRRLLAAAGSALLALLVFLGLVALLPDTRRPELLLALAGAALVAALLTLLRRTGRRALAGQQCRS